MNKSDNYLTKDLAEASFLYALNQKLIKFKEDKGRVIFVFEDRKNCDKLAYSYWRKEAMVNAKEYSDAFRTLKDLIFNR